MEKEHLLFFYSWFHNYVKKFYLTESEQKTKKNIKIKEEHTLRVCEKIVLIGKSLNLDTNELYLAEAAALFHDIGRFRQLKDYGTFDDDKSENHAFIGVKILDEEKILSCLPENERNLILYAVKYHNVRSLPLNAPDECLLFLKMIRDADKLDIMDFFVNYDEVRKTSPNPELVLNLTESDDYSQVFIEDILNSKTAIKKNLKTYNDMKLFYLSWVFDINFHFTAEYILKKQYIEKFIKSLPDNKDTLNICIHLKKHLKKI